LVLFNPGLTIDLSRSFFGLLFELGRGLPFGLRYGLLVLLDSGDYTVVGFFPNVAFV